MSRAEVKPNEVRSSKFSIKPAQVAMLLGLLLATYLLLPQLSRFDATLAIVEHASWLWLAAAIVASLLTSCLAAVIQFGAGNFSGTVADLLVLQFAGSFANHFLPYSLAGIELTVEYYHRLGRPRPRALVLATIPTFFGMIAAVVLVLIISPITLVQLSHTIHVSAWARVAALLLVVVIAVAAARIIYRQPLSKLAQQVKKAVTSLHNPKQLVLVAVGSAVIILLCALTLYTSVRAVHAHIALVTVMVLYVSSLFIGNVAPTPGGLGAIEAVLVLGLSRAGLSLPQAVTATLIYRFATFWLPLLPGGLAMTQLNRRYKRASY